jgi:myo-inositol-1(or 4)-monophosphatase
MNYTLSDVVAVAESAALSVCELLRESRSNADFHVRKKGPNDLVTTADLQAERILVTAIQERFPDHAILSEESFTSLSREDLVSKPLWILDPIDGTANFAHGLPHVATSIAFVERGVTHVGVVSSPFLNEHFVGVKGRGSTLNGALITCGDEKELRNALVATGFPYERERELPQLLRELGAILTNCRDVRRNGSAALDVCHVACRQLSAYYETVKIWDIAAARLIAEEAGAKTGNRLPQPPELPESLNPCGVLITQPSLFPQFLTLFEELSG